MTAEQELSLKAAHLARTAPRQWEQFLAAVLGYSQEQATNCIQSPLAHLPVAQGRAQAIVRLSIILAACVTSAEKIESINK